MSYEPQAHAVGPEWSPAPGVTLQAAAASDIGPVRRLNEDSYLVAPPVFVVADGMGGHGAGDLASQLVTDVFGELAGTAVDADTVGRAVLSASHQVGALARTSDGRAPGTTFAAVCYVEETGAPYWCITSMGDSRVYVLHEGALARVTRDHSVVQELVDRGSISELEASSHPERHVVTRALGADLTTPADFSLVPVEPGSRVLICSDGVWGTVTDPELVGLLSIGTASDAADRLLAAAFAAGGRDNATAVVVDVARVDRAGTGPDLDDTIEVATATSAGSVT